MDTRSDFYAQKSGRFPAAVALAFGLIASTIFGARAIEKLKDSDQTIAVTGSAKRRIKSDRVVWSAEVSSQAEGRAAAYHALAADVPKVTAWLASKGVPAGDLKVQAISTVEIHPHDKEGREMAEVTSAYLMKQSIEVRSSRVDLITDVSREATQLIEQGIAIESEAPQYHYTRLGDLKIEMLGEAARDARVRAERIAKSSGSLIGPLRSARMGVMQVNGADDSETSAEGVNDTASVEKDVMAVMSSSFALQ